MSDDFRDRYTGCAIPFAQGKGALTIRIEHPRFLVTGRVEACEYNWAALTIELTPARYIAEWVVLSDILRSFADRSLPLEQAAEEVVAYLKAELRPASVRVVLRTSGDDGFVYTIITE